MLAEQRRLICATITGTIYLMFIRYFIILIIMLFLPSIASAADIPNSRRSRAVVQKTTPTLSKELKNQGFTLGNPIFLRILKSQALRKGTFSGGELQIFIQGDDGQYKLFKSKPICAASGTQGPKIKTGDGQSPEGFYFISAGRFNPWSSYHLSLNLGYPNAYDRAHDRTGDYLMIHGNCVSIGCYAMTDAGIEEIYTLASAALENGQKIIRVHSFPFPMSKENMALAQGNPHYQFWQNLKQGWDWFEENNAPPNVEIADGKYIFSMLP